MQIRIRLLSVKSPCVCASSLQPSYANGNSPALLVTDMSLSATASLKACGYGAHVSGNEDLLASNCYGLWNKPCSQALQGVHKLIAATRSVVGNNPEKLEAVKDCGAWMKSINHKGNIYFTYTSKEAHVKHRVYVDVDTGRIFK